jgi:opacity protein-like surface antigen
VFKQQIFWMKRILCLILIIPVLTSAQQRLQLTLSGGFSNYYGDLQGKPLTLDQAYAAFGIGLKYDLTNHFAVRGGLFYGRLAADDKKNKPSLQARNLNFRSRVYEANVMAEYALFDLQQKRFTPYIFGGLALFHFNPYTFDSTGGKYYLQPLGTEGQGLSLYPDRKPYSRTQFALPFGGGLRLNVSEKVTLAYEFSLRKTFTDYLDDVSTTYVDPIALAAARGPKAVELSYRGGELKDGNPNYPPAGTIRGGASAKDWYYFSGFTVTIGIGNALLGEGRGKISCPVF